MNTDKQDESVTIQCSMFYITMYERMCEIVHKNAADIILWVDDIEMKSKKYVTIAYIVITIFNYSHKTLSRTIFL